MLELFVVSISDCRSRSFQCRVSRARGGLVGSDIDRRKCL
jgi:hypothetical protein